MVDKWEKSKYKRDRYNSLYMDLAVRISEMSYATRLKVGCVIVSNDTIISYGYNGMPTGCDNNCEFLEDGKLKTKPEVLHAEANAISKVARLNLSTEGAIMYVTHAPCIECAKLIYQSRISELYYKEVYRIEDGLIFLSRLGIKVNQITK